MKNEYIDVDYEECEQKNDSSTSNPDVTVNADPVSASIHGFCGIVNNVTNAVKDYNICRQGLSYIRDSVAIWEFQAKIQSSIAPVPWKASPMPYVHFV